MALQSRHARTVPRRKRPPRRRGRAVRPALSRAARRRPRSCTSSTASTARNPSSPTRSKTSPCCARTACRPITSPPASTTPISRISHIIRGQDHLTNTFKHLLIFEGLGAEPPAVRASSAARRSRWHQALQAPARPGRQRHHLSRCRLPAAGLRQLPLPARLVAQKRPRVPHSRRAHRRLHSRRRQPRQRRLNFTEDDPFDPKAVWLNAEHIRALPSTSSAACLQPFFEQAGFHPTPEKLLAVTPLIRERIKLLRDAVSAADFFFVDQLAPYDPAELIPQKGDAALALPRSCKLRSRSWPPPPSITIRWTKPCAKPPPRSASRPGHVPAHPRRRLRTQKRAAAL